VERLVARELKLVKVIKDRRRVAAVEFGLVLKVVEFLFI
jgi:hypothetical protein